MFGPFVLVTPLFAIVCVVVVTVVVHPRRRRLVAIDEVSYPQLADLRRTSQAARLIAIVVGLVLAYLCSVAGALGRGVMLAPLVLAAVLVIGVLLGDLVSRGAARSADASAGVSAALEPRRVRDYAPRGLSRCVVAGTVTLAGLLAAGWATASSDDQGRAGRSLARCSADGASCAASGPYPGSFYAIPLLVALIVVLLLAAVALVVTVGRPRNADPEIVRVDDVVRRRVAESIVAAAGVGVGSALAGIAQAMAYPLVSTSFGLAVPLVSGIVCLVLSLAGIALAVWSVSSLLVPGAARPRVDPSLPRQAQAA